MFAQGNYGQPAAAAAKAHAAAAAGATSGAGAATTFKPSNVGGAVRRDSVASTSSSCSYSSSSGSSTAGYDSDDTIDEDDDEVATPPFLPADSAIGLGRHGDAPLQPVGAAAGHKGKGKAPQSDDAFLDLDGAFAAFSLTAPDDHLPNAEAEPESVAVAAPASQPSARLAVPHPIPPHTAAATKPGLVPPPSPASKPAPTPLPAAAASTPAPPAPATHTRPLPHPTPPSRAVEESYRGRSRWPRLLWRSELDLDSLVVLKNYHERAVGQPLPVLKADMQPRDVHKWSRRMEYAGL